MARTATKLWENTFQTIPHVSFFDAEVFLPAKIFNQQISFSSIWQGFRAATAKRTSKSDSASNFAQDRPILGSVRPKIMKKHGVGQAFDIETKYRQPYDGFSFVSSKTI